MEYTSPQQSAPTILPGKAIMLPRPSRFRNRLAQNAIPTLYQGPNVTAARILIICCTGAHLLPATGKLKKLPTMARAVNTPARASRLVREESDDQVVCVINKHSFHKKIPFIHKADGGYKK